jgi:hypothetical protein
LAIPLISLIRQLVDQSRRIRTIGNNRECRRSGRKATLFNALLAYTEAEVSCEAAIIFSPNETVGERIFKRDDCLPGELLARGTR